VLLRVRRADTGLVQVKFFKNVPLPQPTNSTARHSDGRFFCAPLTAALG
jgi:hypothetical protein